MHRGKTWLAAILLLLTSLPTTLPAQVTFQRTYGGEHFEEGSSVQQTTDGGYIIVGYTGSFGAGGDDCYLIKTDAAGDTLWTRTLGGTSSDHGRSVQQTVDGGYIVAGFTTSFGAGGYDVYLVKTDADGDTLWTRTFGGAREDVGQSVQQTSDSGYIIASTTYSFGAGCYDAWLIKTNAAGDTVWTRTYGDTIDNAGYSIQQTTDGGFIVAGLTESARHRVYDVWLFKTDADGDTLWTRSFGGTGDDRARSVHQTTDGGYVIAGYTTSFGAGEEDVYLIRTDANGDTLWTRTFGGPGSDQGNSVQQTLDGSYVIAGYTVSVPGGEDVYLIKTDSIGNTAWTKTFGGAEIDWANSARQTSDGGYAIVGGTWSFGTDNLDLFFIKTDSLGNAGVEEEHQSPEIRRTMLDIRPNPTTGLATIGLKHQASSPKPAALRIFDATGRLVLSRALGVERQASSVVLDLRSMPPGVYTARVGNATQRLVLQP